MPLFDNREPSSMTKVLATFALAEQDLTCNLHLPVVLWQRHRMQRCEARRADLELRSAPFACPHTRWFWSGCSLGVGCPFACGGCCRQLLGAVQLCDQRFARAQGSIASGFLRGGAAAFGPPREGGRRRVWQGSQGGRLRQGSHLAHGQASLWVAGTGGGRGTHTVLPAGHDTVPGQPLWQKIAREGLPPQKASCRVGDPMAKWTTLPQRE